MPLTPQEIAALIIRSVCETDPADPDHADTICINVNDLSTLIVSHLEELAGVA